MGDKNSDVDVGALHPPNPPHLSSWSEKSRRQPRFDALLQTAEALDVEAKYFAHCPLMSKLNSDAELVRKIRITKLGFPEG